MQYALLFYQTPEEFAARADPKKREAFWASFVPYMKALNDAAIAPWREHHGLNWQDSEPSLEDVFIELMTRSKDNFQ